MADIPFSNSTVRVSVISPNKVLGLPAPAFLSPNIAGTTFQAIPSLCFMIEHQQAETGATTRMLFDLGLKKHLHLSTPPACKLIQKLGITVETPKDIVQILTERNLAPSDIDTIILSHTHLDHIGDLDLFPGSTRLIVGCRRKVLPGYPTDPDSIMFTADLQTRNIHEVDFTCQSLKIKSLQAVDLFKDGSFYLLDTPGHCLGHISALARTTTDPRTRESSFIMMAGDVCHHAGALRPSQFQPLSRDIIYRTLNCDIRSESLIREFAIIERHCSPFYKPAPGHINGDVDKMSNTINSIQEFDADPRVFVLLAHDYWLLQAIELYPQTVNDWREKKWADETRWQFLKDLDLS